MEEIFLDKVQIYFLHLHDHQFTQFRHLSQLSLFNVII